MLHIHKFIQVHTYKCRCFEFRFQIKSVHLSITEKELITVYLYWCLLSHHSNCLVNCILFSVWLVSLNRRFVFLNFVKISLLIFFSNFNIRFIAPFQQSFNFVSLFILLNLFFIFIAYNWTSYPQKHYIFYTIHSYLCNTFTGRAWLIWSYSFARISFKLSGNLN